MAGLMFIYSGLVILLPVIVLSIVIVIFYFIIKNLIEINRKLETIIHHLEKKK